VRRLLTDNGGNYRSRDLRAVVTRHRLMHRRTRMPEKWDWLRLERLLRIAKQLADSRRFARESF